MLKINWLRYLFVMIAALTALLQPFNFVWNACVVHPVHVGIETTPIYFPIPMNLRSSARYFDSALNL